LDYHVNSICKWTSVNTAKLASKLQEHKGSLQTSLDSFDLLPQEINVLVDACSDACTLASQVQRTFKARLIDTIGLYKGYSNLTYVLVRIFRKLAAKEFCSDNVESNDDANTSVEGKGTQNPRRRSGPQPSLPRLNIAQFRRCRN
jgi:hypothetical protein